MVEKLDDYLLKRIQKIVDQIHDVFGVTKFRLAIWLIITATISLNLFCIIERHFDPWDIVVNSLFVFNAFFYCLTTKHYEREFLRENTLHEGILSTLSPCVRIFYIVLFLLSCVVVSLSKQSMFLALWLLTMTLWMYVDICVPRKPNKSKVRKWIDGTLTRLGEMLEPQPELIPVRNN